MDGSIGMRNHIVKEYLLMRRSEFPFGASWTRCTASPARASKRRKFLPSVPRHFGPARNVDSNLSVLPAVITVAWYDFTAAAVRKAKGFNASGGLEKKQTESLLKASRLLNTCKDACHGLRPAFISILDKCRFCHTPSRTHSH